MSWRPAIALCLFCASPFLCGSDGGCGPAPPPHTYLIERTALVPLPAPDLTNRAPGGVVEFDLGDAALLWARAPTLSSGSVAGLYVPRHQPTGMVRVPVARWVNLRSIVEILPTGGALAVPAGRLAPSEQTGATYGGGVGAGGYLSRRAWLSGSVDFMVAAIPSALRTTCTDCGTRDPGVLSTSTDFLPVGRLQLNAGIDVGPVEFTASLALRNHPVNRAQDSVVSTSRPEPTADLSAGPPMLIPALSIAWRPMREVALIANVYLPVDVTNTAVRYAPVLGLLFSGAFPSPWNAQPPRPGEPPEHLARPGATAAEASSARVAGGATGI